MTAATQTPEERSSNNDLIPLEQIQKYVNENIPILPLGPDGKQDVRNLFTKEELDSLRSDPNILLEGEKKEVFYVERDYKSGKDIPKVHYLLLLSKFIPREFWTTERIKRQIWVGIAFLTGPTKIPASSDPNKKLWGVGVDADDDKTRYVLENLVDEKDLKRKAIVQTTPHKGMHIIFFVAVNPTSNEEVNRWRNRALSLRLCKDCKIEIKTATMQLTLDPSKHRIDKTLGYTRISDGIKIWESDWLYDLLIERLINQGCLKCSPEEYHTNYQIEAEQDSKYLEEIANRRDEDREEFTETQMQKGIEIFLGEDEENKKENRLFDTIFRRGTKHDVLMYWGAHCYFHNITLEHAKLFAQKLDNATGNPDNPLRLEPIEEAYRRGRNRQSIRGKSGFIEAFSAACKNGPNRTLARQRLEKLNVVLDLEDKKPKKKGGSSSKERNAPNQADVIVKLALENIPFCFKNQFKEYCAVVKVVTATETHYEVMNMEDHNFSSALRYLWEQENIAQNRPLKTTVSQDHIKQARATLESKIDHSGVPRIKTHLRVAWKEENKIIRYDLSNDRWQQVEISGSEDGKSGVRIVDSDNMIKEIEEWKKCKFDPNKIPVLFRRYESNDSQVLPDMNFESDVYDNFILNLTNVIGNKSADMAKKQVEHFKTEGSLLEDTKSCLLKLTRI